jgi:hypothetical protein
MLVSLILLGISAQASEPPSAIAGDWEVARVVPTSNIQTAPDKKKLGQVLQFRRGRARLADVSLSDAHYAVRWSNPREVAADYRVPAQELGLSGEKILIVDVTSAKGSAGGLGSKLIVKSPGTLLAPWDGVFYELKRRSVRRRN